MQGALASFQMPSLCNSIEKLAVSRLSHLSVFYINRGLEYNRQWLKWFRVVFPKVEEFTFIVNASGQQHGEYGDLVQSDDLPTINRFQRFGHRYRTNPKWPNNADIVPLKFNVMEFRKQ